MLTRRSSQGHILEPLGDGERGPVGRERLMELFQVCEGLSSSPYSQTTFRLDHFTTDAKQCGYDIP